MRKIKLLLEYDGADYHGWQTQPGEITVQGVLEYRISQLTGEPAKVLGAGRTDAGVHALAQVAAFRTESAHDISTIKKALNATLPEDIRIIDVTEVPDSFNPRDDAFRKSYFYIIAKDRKPPVFLHGYSWTVPQLLDVPSMVRASRTLIGTHDFTSFMGAGSDIKNTVREVFSLDIEEIMEIDFMTARLKGNFIRVRIEAKGFLRHMVRNIVGTLVEIGRGRISPERLKEILEARDRKLAGQTAPARGLFLERIVY
jgi:tRNA pseudouridine38-40 synthase